MWKRFSRTSTPQDSPKSVGEIPYEDTTLNVQLLGQFESNARALGIKIPALEVGGLSASVVDTLIYMDMAQVDVIDEKNRRASLASHKGGYINVDRDSEKQQHRLARRLIKEMGQHLFQGSGLMSVSLPIYIFEPESLLARLPRALATTSLLDKAAADRAHRFETVIAYIISSLSSIISFKKPFTPLDGETLEARLGRTDVTSELVYPHINKESPLVLLLLNNINYVLSALISIEVRSSIRCTTGTFKGEFRLTFPDGDVVTWTLPIWKIKGVVTGSMSIKYKERLAIHSNSGVSCSIVFDTGGKRDGFRGDILDKSGRRMKTISGRWLKECLLDEKIQLWSIGTPKTPLHFNPLDTCLKSDWRYRKDVRFLACGNGRDALTAKREVEIRQRVDRKKRQARKDSL